MGALNRGIRDFDVVAAYDSLRKSATEPARGWERLADYMRFGYIPTLDLGVSHPVADSAPGRPDVVNRTPGYPYEDYCIAQLARTLGLERLRVLPFAFGQLPVALRSSHGIHAGAPP